MNFAKINLPSGALLAMTRGVTMALFLMTASIVQGAQITAGASFFNPNNSSDFVNVTAVFNNSGLTGVGTEDAKVDGDMTFWFSTRGYYQRPNLSYSIQQGTFMAHYVNGIFQGIYSLSGAGGYANPPAAVSPSAGGWNAEYIHLAISPVQDTLSDRIQYNSVVHNYGTLPDTKWAVTHINGNPVPIPGAAWLLGSGLAGLIGYRRKGSKWRLLPAG